MPLLEFTGAAVVTALNAGIGPADTSIQIKNGGGWPTGATAPFIATIGDPLAGDAEEKILVTSRTGETLNGCTRGRDGTPPQSWGPNTRIRHTISAEWALDLSRHQFDPTRHDHTQYLRSVDHAGIVHTAAMLGTDSVGNDELQDNSVALANMQDASVGTAELINNAVTTAKIGDDQVTGPKFTGGRGIVRQFDEDIDSSTFSDDADTDMVLNNVPVVAGRTYAIHLHSRFIFASLVADARWVIRLRLNGVDFDIFDDLQPVTLGNTRGTIDATVYWTPSVSAATDDLLVRLDKLADGAQLTLVGSGTGKRTLTLTDVGIPTP